MLQNKVLFFFQAATDICCFCFFSAVIILSQEGICLSNLCLALLAHKLFAVSDDVDFAPVDSHFFIPLCFLLFRPLP